MASRGLYTIATRAPGTVITALIYNTDHQAHVNGRNALFLLSNGQSEAQFQATTDPFPGASENLAPTWGGELERLRFTIAQIKQVLTGSPATPPLWYDAIPEPGFAPIGDRVQRTTTQSIPDSSATPLSFTGGTTTFNSGVWEGVINPTRFTAPSSGLYLVSSSVLWASATGGFRQIAVGVNGSTTAQPAQTNTVTVGAHTQLQSVTGLLNLTATDYVEFFVTQATGGAVNVTPHSVDSAIGSMVYFGVLGP